MLSVDKSAFTVAAFCTGLFVSARRRPTFFVWADKSARHNFCWPTQKNVCLCRQIEPTKKLSADINRLTEKQQQLRPICRAAVLWYATCSTLSTTTKRSTGTTLHGSFSGFDSDWLATDPVLSAFLSSVFGARQ